MPLKTHLTTHAKIGLDKETKPSEGISCKNLIARACKTNIKNHPNASSKSKV